MRPLHLWIPGAGAIRVGRALRRGLAGLYSADEGATESSTRIDDVDGQVEIMHIDRRSDMYRWPVGYCVLRTTVGYGLLRTYPGVPIRDRQRADLMP